MKSAFAIITKSIAFKKCFWKACFVIVLATMASWPALAATDSFWAVIWGGAKHMGGGKRTRERALPEIFGPFQKSFWSALSWISVQEKQIADTWGGWKTYRTRGGGGPKPFLGRRVIREVFHPPLFSTPPSPWRPLIFPKDFRGSERVKKSFFFLVIFLKSIFCGFPCPVL